VPALVGLAASSVPTLRQVGCAVAVQSPSEMADSNDGVYADMIWVSK